MPAKKKISVKKAKASIRTIKPYRKKIGLSQKKKLILTAGIIGTLGTSLGIGALIHHLINKKKVKLPKPKISIVTSPRFFSKSIMTSPMIISPNTLDIKNINEQLIKDNKTLNNNFQEADNTFRQCASEFNKLLENDKKKDNYIKELIDQINFLNKYKTQQIKIQHSKEESKFLSAQQASELHSYKIKIRELEEKNKELTEYLKQLV